MANMTKKARGAYEYEYPELFTLFQTAFKEDEAELFDFLAKNDPTLTPDCIRVATVDDMPVACSVVLLREIRTLHGNWVPGAVITLVACDPKYQNRGFGSLAVKDSLAYAARAGASLALLYGHPGYYPRFGFAPVLPAAIATLAVDGVLTEGMDDCSKRTPAAETGCARYAKIVKTHEGYADQEGQGRCEAEDGQADQAEHRGRQGHVTSRLLVREIQNSDVPILLGLYESQLAGYPCSVRRDASPWLWKPRGVMAGRDVLVFLDTQSGQVVGYSYCIDNPDKGYLTVTEAAALDKAVASCIVSSLARRAAVLGRRHLKVSMSPDSVVFQAALDKGADMEYKAAAAGMACVLSWEGLLPDGYRVERIGDGQVQTPGFPRAEGGEFNLTSTANMQPEKCQEFQQQQRSSLSPDDTFNLFYRDELILIVGRAPLTRLVLGYDDAGSFKSLENSGRRPSVSGFPMLAVKKADGSLNGIKDSRAVEFSQNTHAGQTGLSGLTGCDPRICDLFRKDFPKSFPKWYLAPYWY